MFGEWLPNQCECGRPVPHMPHDLGCPVQVGPSLPPVALEAKTESFLLNLSEPHCGQGVPSHLVERTSTSLSRPHFSQ